VATKDWDELLTVAEIAREFRISEESVRRWIKDGLIPFKLIGPFKMKRIRRGDLVKNVVTGQTLEQEEDPIVTKR